MDKPLLEERDRIAAEVRAIKTGAAELSQLLAEDALDADEWERAALVLDECRTQRKRLDERLHQIDETVALMWDCDL